MKANTILCLVSFLPLAFSFVEWQANYFGTDSLGVEVYHDIILVFTPNGVYGFSTQDGHLIFNTRVRGVVDYALLNNGFMLLTRRNIITYALGKSQPFLKTNITHRCEEPLFINAFGCYSCKDGVGCAGQWFLTLEGMKSPPLTYGDSVYVVSDDTFYRIKHSKIIFRKKVGFSNGIPPVVYKNQILVPVENRVVVLSPVNGQIYFTRSYRGWISSLLVNGDQLLGSTHGGVLFVWNEQERRYDTDYSIIKTLFNGWISTNGVVLRTPKGDIGIVPLSIGEIEDGATDGQAFYLLTPRFLVKFSAVPAPIFLSPSPYQTLDEGEVNVRVQALGGDFDLECRVGNDTWKHYPTMANFSFEISHYPYGEVPIQCRLAGIKFQTYTLTLLRSPDALKKVFYPFFRRRINCFDPFVIRVYDENGKEINDVDIAIGNAHYRAGQKIRLLVPGKYLVVISKKGYYSFSGNVECLPPPICTAGALLIFLLLIGFFMFLKKK